MGLGAADFMARFSARALGATLTYAAVLLVGRNRHDGRGSWRAALELVWSPLGSGIAVLHGVCVAVMCILLYMGIARGPIAVVVPIVAAHPALVLVINVSDGVAAERDAMGGDGGHHRRQHPHRPQRRGRERRAPEARGQPGGRS